MSDRLHVSFEVGAVTVRFKDQDAKTPTLSNSFLPNWGLGCRADWGLRTTVTLASRCSLLGLPSNAVRRDFPRGFRSMSSWPRPSRAEKEATGRPYLVTVAEACVICLHCDALKGVAEKRSSLL